MTERIKPRHPLPLLLSLSGLFLVCLVPVERAFCAEHPSHGTVRRLYEWGVYDSLKTALEPYLSAMPDSASESRIAEYRLYLGVAYFAEGKLGEARNQFGLAFESDSTLQPEPYYVPEEVIDLYASTVEDIRERQQLLARRDSILESEQLRLRGKLEYEEIVAGRRRCSTLGVSSYVVAVACAGAAVYAFRRAEEAHARMLAEVQEHDPRGYRKYREIVRKADVATVAAGVGALVCSVSGSLLTVRAIRRGRKARRLAVAIEGNGVYVCLRF